MPFYRFLAQALLFLLIVSLQPVWAQPLLDSRRTSAFTYIYRIGNEDAERIYLDKDNIRRKQSSVLQSLQQEAALVDSFPTGSRYSTRLPAGHYLRVYAKGAEEITEISSVDDFDLHVVENSTDLCLQVLDLEGKPRADAVVRIGRRQLRFDLLTQSYRIPKTNKRGIIAVSCGEAQAFYQLSRGRNNPALLRGFRNLRGGIFWVLYTPPLKYIWSPVHFALRIPQDVVRTLIPRYGYWHFQGTVRSIAHFFPRVLGFNREYEGYIVLNKPQYRPGDTLRYKAYIMNRRMSPLRRQLHACINQGWNSKALISQSLRPYRKGAYEGYFVLHDSLKMKLDDSYYLSLRKSWRRTCQSQPFTFAEYELDGNKLAMRTDTSVQYRGHSFSAYARATDENGLGLPDGRLEVTAIPVKLHDFPGSLVSMPDTLLHFTRRLSMGSETAIAIPDSAFPAARFDYRLEAKLRTADNKIKTWSKQIAYLYEKAELRLSLEADSVHCGSFRNGRSQPRTVLLYGQDRFGNKKLLMEASTPFSCPLNSFYARYRAVSQDDSLSDSLEVAKFQPLLECSAERSGRQLSLEVSNPRQLVFSYYLYYKNKEILRGYGDSLSFEHRAGKAPYTIALNYAWGGKSLTKTIEIPYDSRSLRIAVSQPALVFPGQKAPVELRVTDHRGRPVADADIAAYAETAKFNAQTPNIYGRREPRRKGKVLVNRFSIRDQNPYWGRQNPLMLPRWARLERLDTVEYYRFLYPGKKMYRSEYPAKDGRAQFAPFVMKNGVSQPIQLIYVDSKPVFFAWASNPIPYSFAIDPGKRHVTIRTREQVFYIDSLPVYAGKKLIISIDAEHHQQRGVKSMQQKDRLELGEHSYLSSLTMPYLENFNGRPAFLSSKDQLFLLNKEWSRSSGLAGPLRDSATFQLAGKPALKFWHESSYQHEFYPPVIKLRERKNELVFSPYLNYSTPQPLHDLLLDRQKIEQSWNDLQAQQMRKLWLVYKIPPYIFSSITGCASLQIMDAKNALAKENDLSFLYIIRAKNIELLSAYPAYTYLLKLLPTEPIRLAYLFKDGRCLVSDSLVLSGTGINYWNYNEQSIQPADSLLRERLLATIKEFNSYSIKRYKENDDSGKSSNYGIKLLTPHEIEAYKRLGYLFVQGTVKDNLGPMESVNIKVLETGQTTVSDWDGNYTISIPNKPDSHLLFSYMGKEDVKVAVNGRLHIDVIMQSGGVSELREVVCVKVRQRAAVGGRDITSSVSIRGIGIPVRKRNWGYVRPPATYNATAESPASAPGFPATALLTPALAELFAKDRPLVLLNGELYGGDIQALAGSIAAFRVLSAQEAAIFSPQAGQQVVSITTVGDESRAKGADFDADFLAAAQKDSSLRKNFSDAAFWQPRLRTDKQGIARFEARFPDDATRWSTHCLAIDGRQRVGTASGSIKSYKPLMSRLSLPRFLVAGDTAYGIGKTVNYLPGTAIFTSRLAIGGKEIFSRQRSCRDAVVDTFALAGSGDSVSLRYSAQSLAGFTDSEQQGLPIFPAGLSRAEGLYAVLDKDTAWTFQPDTAAGKATLHAEASILQIVSREVSQLIHYEYWCNEQIASKLKALLAERQIAQHLGKETSQDRQVKKMIALLEKNQTGKNQWGWWPGTDRLPWVTVHVYEALLAAQKQGFAVPIDRHELGVQLVHLLGQSASTREKLKMLSLLKQADAPVDYKEHLHLLAPRANKPLGERLQAMELSQLLGLPASLDSLKPYRRQTAKKGLYLSENLPRFSLFDNDIQHTLAAYRIIRRSGQDSAALAHIRNYLAEAWAQKSWGNTYQTALLVETILPDLLGSNQKLDLPVLKIGGDKPQALKDFPCTLELSSKQATSIAKSGDCPVYICVSQRIHHPKPAARKGTFAVQTRWMQETRTRGELVLQEKMETIKAGESITLEAEVIVKEDAEYVMISIPIPAGCSYSESRQRHFNETHREYFKDRLAIFCQKLPAGTYRFPVRLNARFAGSYTLNPAQAELMYFPVNSGNNEIKRVRIGR